MKAKTAIAVATLIGLGSTPVAGFSDEHDASEIPFDVAEVFFELNNTDGDLGIHALIDGEPWKRLQIEDADERRLLNVGTRGRLRRQGLTEIFFESAEPTFDELSPKRFFERFPEGTYDVEGRTLEGDELESETEVTHAMPAPPQATVNYMPTTGVCDDEDPGYGPTEVTGPSVVIAWNEVMLTHPALGSPLNSPDISIYNYQVVVEAELDEITTVFSVVLPMV